MLIFAKHRIVQIVNKCVAHGRMSVVVGGDGVRHLCVVLVPTDDTHLLFHSVLSARHSSMDARNVRVYIEQQEGGQGTMYCVWCVRRRISQAKRRISLTLSASVC